MSPHRTHPVARRALVVIALVLGTTACATTYDKELEPNTSPSTSTTLPSGTAAELLPQLSAEALSLSGVMIDGGDDDAVAEQIAALWTAARDEVLANRPDLIDGFDQNVAMVARAVQFKRAADADKAAKNIQTLVETYLA